MEITHEIIEQLKIANELLFLLALAAEALSEENEIRLRHLIPSMPNENCKICWHNYREVNIMPDCGMCKFKHPNSLRAAGLSSR